MQKHPRVPFILCRPGTRLQFDTFMGQPQEGVVKALTVYGANNYLVLLSEYKDQSGQVHGEHDPVTNDTRRINLDHATRILSHGSGELVFEPSGQYVRERIRQELAGYRAEGALRRQGQRWVVDGRQHYAEGVVRSMVLAYVQDNEKALGILPWELIDLDKLLSLLIAHGVVRYELSKSVRVFDRGIPLGATVNIKRFKRFLQQNINRVKVDLKKEEKARLAEEEAFEREEMERDMRRERLLRGEPVDDGLDFTDEELALQRLVRILQRTRAQAEYRAPSNPPAP